MSIDNMVNAETIKESLVFQIWHHMIDCSISNQTVKYVVFVKWNELSMTFLHCDVRHVYCDDLIWRNSVAQANDIKNLQIITLIIHLAGVTYAQWFDLSSIHFIMP